MYYVTINAFSHHVSVVMCFTHIIIIIIVFLPAALCWWAKKNNNNNNNNNIHVRGTDRPRVYLDFPDPPFHAESISLHTSVLRFSQYICFYIKNV